MKKCIFTIIIAALGFSASDAQVGNYVGFSYSLGFPAPDLRDYNNKMSGRGLYIEYYYNISPGVFVGLSSGWNIFEDSENDFSTGDSELPTGRQNRRTDSFPIFLNFSFLFETDGIIRPYVSFGAGALYIERDTEVGDITQETENLQFALKPEFGTIFRFKGSTGIKFSTKYYQAFSSPDLDGQSYLAVDLGLVFLANY